MQSGYRSRVLDGFILDYYVGLALGRKDIFVSRVIKECYLKPNTIWLRYHPTSNWQQAGPLLKAHHINTEYIGTLSGVEIWQSFMGKGEFARKETTVIGDNPTLAICRCFVLEQYGEEISTTLFPIKAISDG